MQLVALIARYRSDSGDTATPPFCTDAQVRDFLNEAQDEAAIRRRMLRATAESAPDLCLIEAAAGTAIYALNPLVFELSYQAWRDAGATFRTDLYLATREWMDSHTPGWRDMEPDTPRYLVKDGHSLQLVPAPIIDGQILLEGYHTSDTQMAADEDQPGIPAIHHLRLVAWALYCAFSIPDADNFDPARASRAEAEFTRYFGARPDADLRSDTREDQDQHIVAHWV